jgi:hypothetical protein
MNESLIIIKDSPSSQEACCAPEIRLTIRPTQAEQAATLFAALGDPTRITILNLLAESDSEVYVCDITTSFKLGQPTTSHHHQVYYPKPSNPRGFFRFTCYAGFRRAWLKIR